MAHCVKCRSEILDDVQHYFMRDIGTEIISLIEQTIGFEVPNDDKICEACFSRMTQFLSEKNCLEGSSENNDAFTPVPHDTNICVCCQASLFQKQQHNLPEGPERNLIAEKIYPRQIPQAALVCLSCWESTRSLLPKNTAERQVDQNKNEENVINLNKCVLCRTSVYKRRRHTLPNGPEREEIAGQIHPREIPDGGRACYTCWMATKRRIQRRIKEQHEDPILPYNRHHDDNCAWCETSLHRRRTHILPQGDKRDFVISEIRPRELPSNALLCSECSLKAQAGVLSIEVPTPKTMTLHHYRISPHTSSRCFVPGCDNKQRLSIPNYFKKSILKRHKLFINTVSRVCAEHRTTYNWEMLKPEDFSNVFTQAEVQEMLDLAIEEDNEFINFEKIDNINDGLLEYFIGMTKMQFHSVLRRNSMLLNTFKKSKTALGVYLIKSRTGDSYRRISSLLQINVSQVCRYYKKTQEVVRNADLGL